MHHRGGCVLPDARPAERAVLHRSPGHYFLQHYYTLLGVRAKGEKLKKLSCFTTRSSFTSVDEKQWIPISNSFFRTTVLEAALTFISSALDETSGPVNRAVKMSNVLAQS